MSTRASVRAREKNKNLKFSERERFGTLKPPDFHMGPASYNPITQTKEGVPYDAFHAPLFTVFTNRFPDWSRFRGAQYCGRATHDPLAQNLIVNMLLRGSATHLPRDALMSIARYVLTGEGLVSPRLPVLLKVCKPDACGNRLCKAAALSRRVRRAIQTIPQGCSLWDMYQTWTRNVAECSGANDHTEILYSVPEDPCDFSISSVNRLTIRGLTKEKLDYKILQRRFARPAYIPSAAQFSDWMQLLETQAGKDNMIRLSERLKESLDRNLNCIDRHIDSGDILCIHEAGGCIGLQQQCLKQCVEAYSTLYCAMIQQRILKNIADLYTKLYLLGLNDAERDWFYMMNPDEHYSAK
eukprot:1654383-Rhodomonas_salina.1